MIFQKPTEHTQTQMALLNGQADNQITNHCIRRVSSMESQVAGLRLLVRCTRSFQMHQV